MDRLSRLASYVIGRLQPLTRTRMLNAAFRRSLSFPRFRILLVREYWYVYVDEFFFYFFEKFTFTWKAESELYRAMGMNGECLRDASLFEMTVFRDTRFREMV